MDIFLSYSTINEDIATRVYETLTEQGHRCWFAPVKIPGGTYFAKEIMEGIKACKIFLLILSEHSCSSRYVASELAAARSYNKYIIPFRVDASPLDEATEFQLNTTQWIDAFNDPYEEKLEELLSRIQEVLAYWGLHVRDTSGQRVAGDAGDAGYVLETVSLTGRKQLVPYSRTDPGEIGRIRSAYVPVPNYEQAKAKLLSNHLLIVHHSSRTGKYTTALHISGDATGSEVFQLLPTVTLEHLLRFPYKPGAAYIIDHVSNELWNELSLVSLKLLSERLKSNKAYLLLTSTADAGAEEEHKQFLFHHAAPEQPSLIIRKWASAQAADAEETDRIRAYLAIPEVEQFVRSGLLPYEAKAFAEELQRAAIGETSTEELVSSLRNNVKTRIAAYFERTLDLNQLYLLISLCVYREMPTDWIYDASTRLGNLHSPGGHAAASLPFSKPKEQFLQAVAAETFRKTVQTEVGTVEKECIRFVAPKDAEHILHYVWGQFPDYRNVILQWLAQENERAPNTAKQKVIDTLIFLGKTDFAAVKNRVLQVWAGDRSPAKRLLAVQAAVQFFKEKEYIPNVANMLKHWASLDSYSLQWCVLAAYKTPMGVGMLTQALGHIRKIGRNRRGQLPQMAQDCLQYLMLETARDSTISIYILENVCGEMEKCANVSERLTILSSILGLLRQLPADTVQSLLMDKTFRKSGLKDALWQAVYHKQTRPGAQELLHAWFCMAAGKELFKEYMNLFFLELYLYREESLKGTFQMFLDERFGGEHAEVYKDVVSKMIQMERGRK